MSTLSAEDKRILREITDHLESIERPEFLLPTPQVNLPNGAWFLQGDELGIGFADFRQLIDAGEIIEFSRPDVGVLFQFYGNFRAMVTKQYLLELPKRRNLSDPEILEVEHLLNKGGSTLGIELPVLPVATDDDIKEAFFEILKSQIARNPIKLYREFTETMARNGHPIELKQKDFKKFAEENLKL
jgi:hypothetical protein